MRITNNMIMRNTKGNINGNKTLLDLLNNQMTTQEEDRQTFGRSCNCNSCIAFEK